MGDDCFPMLMMSRTKTRIQPASQFETEEAVAWILCRVGFGATTADLDHAVVIGFDAFLEELFEPEEAGIPDDGDPWAGLDLPVLAKSPKDGLPVVQAWLARMLTASRPAREWLAWFWHGHLVTSLASVRSPLAMANQIRLFRELGSGEFGTLLRAVSIDSAMLRYLDGDKSTGSNPNENFSRELLELFSLGIGNYSEADVTAGALALTGWSRKRGEVKVQFFPGRHDNSSHDYLGTSGVHDLDTVIAAVTGHGSCGPFIVRSLAEQILGPTHAEAAVAQEVDQFVREGLLIGPLLRRLVEKGAIAGGSGPQIISPVPWLVGAIRATNADVDSLAMVRLLRTAGQTPMLPPNVSGWPSGDAWLTTSGTVARLNMAGVVAKQADSQSAPIQAASAGDIAQLARSLGRPAGFSGSTTTALEDSGTTGRSLLSLALSSPDMVVS